MKYLGDKKEAEQVLKEENVGRLGMFNQDYPYVVPICYAYEQGSIYLHSGIGGQKLYCIERNNRVCFQVDQVLKLRESDSACDYGFNYRSVIALGRAEEIIDDKLKMKALELITHNFTGSKQVKPIDNKDMKGVVVAKISIEDITVKTNEKKDIA